MQGSIRQRSAGSFELRVFVGVDPETRRKRYRSMTFRGNRGEAERELAAMITSVESERLVGARSPVSELLEGWFALAAPGWSPTTVRQTRSVLNCYLLPGLGDIRIGDVTPTRINTLYASLAKTGSMKDGPLAAGTLARVHVVLRSAFSHAMRAGWVWDNPVDRAHRITVAPVETRPPTPGELHRLIDQIAERDPLMCLFVVLAAVTGARRAEMLALRWDNIKLGRGRIEFAAGLVEGPNGPVLAPTKTRRTHSVDIDADTIELLASHRDKASNAIGFVFSDDNGVTAWKPNRVTKTFIRHRRDAGLRRFRLHDLRHFMATEMLDADVPLVVVARRLNHRRVSTTLDKYAHVVPGRDAAASATISRIIRRAS